MDVLHLGLLRRHIGGGDHRLAEAVPVKLVRLPEAVHRCWIDHNVKVEKVAHVVGLSKVPVDKGPRLLQVLDLEGVHQLLLDGRRQHRFEGLKGADHRLVVADQLGAAAHRVDAPVGDRRGHLALALRVLLSVDR